MPGASQRARYGGGRPGSLRARLTVATAALLLVALAVGAVLLTGVLQRSRVAALDDALRARAATLAQLVTTDQVPDPLPVAEPGETAQLLDGQGRVLASSANASRTLPVLPADEVAALTSRAGDDVLLATSTRGTYDGVVRVAVRRMDEVTVLVTLPLSEVQGLVRALAWALTAVVPVLTALFALAVWVVLGRALAPVERLRVASAQVAVDGGPGWLPVPRGDDELAALARTLNAMLDALEAAAVRQRRFVADAAHELRSPLAGMRAAVEVAQAHPEAYSAPELADELHGQVVRLQRLVDDLLLLARVGAAPRGPALVDLAALVGSLIGPVGAPSVTTTGSGSALADEDSVLRMLRNLLDNATRHSRSAVAVGVAPGRVDVDDDGPGIPAGERDRVFERFVRLDEARERDAGGSGLGLAIARELAREAGGDVLLADSPLGGLRATVVLPTA